MITTYELTMIIVCGDDGLISTSIKGIKEIIPRDPEEEGENGD